jgi:hypothetical protein
MNSKISVTSITFPLKDFNGEGSRRGGGGDERRQEEASERRQICLECRERRDREGPEREDKGGRPGGWREGGKRG